MANEIRLKRGSGSDPSASDLSVGEIAIRTDNGKLFTKRDNGSVTEITGGGGIDDGDKGDITVSNSGATFTIDDGVITSTKIANGTIGTNDIALTAIDATLIAASSISNAKVASNAAIAGSKIDPDFGSQNIVTTGNVSGANLNLTGQATITATNPKIDLVDSNGDDYSIDINGGVFNITDETASTTRFSIATDGQLNIAGKLNCNGGLDTDGDVKFNSGTTNMNILFDASQQSLEFDDSVKATFGFDRDLQIFFDGTHSKIDHTPSGGSLFLGGDSLVLANSCFSQYYLDAAEDGAVNIRHSGNTKISTSSSGATVTGTLVATAFTGALTGNVTGNASGSSGSCTGNAATATALANARTIAGVSFDGTANISLNNNAITNGAGYITSADGGNAATLDGIDSSQFVRADTDDSMLGDMTIGNGSGQTRLNIKKADNNVADHIKLFNGTTLVGTIGVEDNSWLRLNQEVGANIYTPNYIRADNGFVVDNITVVDGSANVIGARVSGTVSNATRAENLGGASPSVGASNGTIVQRHSSGYIFSNYINTTDNTVSSGIGSIVVKLNNGDNYHRSGTAAAVRSFLNVADGATAGIATGSNASLNQLDITGNHGIDNEGWYRTDDSGDGMYNTGTTQHFYSDHDDAWNVAGGSSANYIRFRDEYAGSIRGYVYANSSNQVGFLDQSGNWRLQVVSSSYTASSNHFYPSQNNTYSLGSSSLRWSDVFTADLHLSNEAKGGNDVDGSWGDWTLQEGEDTVYMLNNRNGKKFKMLLQEVT